MKKILVIALLSSMFFVSCKPEEVDYNTPLVGFWRSVKPQPIGDDHEAYFIMEFTEDLNFNGYNYYADSPEKIEKIFPDEYEVSFSCDKENLTMRYASEPRKKYVYRYRFVGDKLNFRNVDYVRME